MQNNKPIKKTSTLAIINLLFFIINFIFVMLIIIAGMNGAEQTTKGTNNSSAIMSILWLATLIMSIIDVRADNRKKTLSKCILIIDLSMVGITVIAIILPIFFMS